MTSHVFLNNVLHVTYLRLKDILISFGYFNKEKRFSLSQKPALKIAMTRSWCNGQFWTPRQSHLHLSGTNRVSNPEQRQITSVIIIIMDLEVYCWRSCSLLLDNLLLSSTIESHPQARVSRRFAFKGFWTFLDGLLIDSRTFLSKRLSVLQVMTRWQFVLATST